jgi:hypothetical protein
MWNPRRLTDLWPSNACYRDSFTFLTFFLNILFQRYTVSTLPLNKEYPNAKTSVKVSIFCNLTPYNLLEVSRRFGGNSCLLQVRKVSQARIIKQLSWLILRLEDGGSILLWNQGNYLPDHTESHAVRTSYLALEGMDCDCFRSVAHVSCLQWSRQRS